MGFIKLILQFFALLGIIGFITYIGENKKENFFLFGNYEGFRKYKFFRVFNRIAYVSIWFMASAILFERNENSFWSTLQIILFFLGIYVCVQVSINEHKEWLENQKTKKQNQNNSQKTFAEVWDSADEKTRAILAQKLINDSLNSMTDEDIRRYAKSKGYHPVYVNNELLYVKDNEDVNSNYDPSEDLDNYDYDEYLMEQADLGNTAAFALKAERDRKRTERNL